MIRSIVFPRKAGNSLEEMQPALDLFRALGFSQGNEWHERGAHGVEQLAPAGGIEFIAALEAPAVDVMVEVSDAEEAYAIVQNIIANVAANSGSDTPALAIRREIGDTADGARLFEVEVSGLRLGFLTRARKVGDSHGLEGALDARGKKFAIVVSRFNSFITERLLDGALQALRQCGAQNDDVTIVHVPGAFEIPSASRQLAETKQYAAIVCVGCLIRGGTLHYEVIANEVTRGVGQAAQETGVPHAFGVLTCDTLEQAIDRAGLKAGNKGFEAGLAAVEMASLNKSIGKKQSNRKGKTAGPSATLRSAQDDKSEVMRSPQDDKSAEGAATPVAGTTDGSR